MNDLLVWQATLIVWAQSLSPALDSFFKTVNFLATEDFMLIALPIVWWCINKRVGASLIILFTSCEFLSRFLKSATGEIRPYDLDKRIRNLDPQPDSSFPSSGAMDALIFWGYLALQFRNRALWVWTIVVLVLVGCARVYLGAHYPTDVFASIIIGTVILAIVTRANIAERIMASPRTALWIMAIGLPLLLVLIRLNSETAVSLGALLGFNIALLIETQFVRFDPHGAWWKQIIKIAIGLGIGFGLRIAIKPLLPAGDIFTLVRYTIIGFWLGVGAPWVFVQTKLAQKEK